MSNLLNLSPADFCEATNACAEGRDWALTQPTMADVWDNCPRLDWLLWIADKLEHRPDDRTLRLFAIWCTRNTPLADGRITGDLLTDRRSWAALEVAERYADGKATDEELAAAWDARVAARDAARNAAWAAAWAAEDAADAADAARAAAGAAQDAARAAAWAARDAAEAAAWAAAGAAAWAAEDAADAADAARAAAWDAQADHFRTLVKNPFQKEALA